MKVFLSVPTDLALWRKLATINLLVEFAGERITRDFMASWNKQLPAQWAKIEELLAPLQDTWSKTVALVERHERRQQQVASESTRLALIVDTLGEQTATMYMAGTYDLDIGDINDTLGHMGALLRKQAAQLQQEAAEVGADHLEQFRAYLDYLVALVGMFERYRRLGGNTVAAVSKQISHTEERLAAVNANPDAKGLEVDRLRSTLQELKHDMFEQVNREWLIRQCVLNEVVMFQETQYVMGRAFADWVATRARHGRALADEWQEVAGAMQRMPERGSE